MMHRFTRSLLRLRPALELAALIFCVGVCAAVFVIGRSHRAAAGSAEDCRAFHQECTDARAAGYRDAGICHVERLECPAERDTSVPQRSHKVPDDDGDVRERAVRGR